MDFRAYHLFKQSHYAVAQALARGELARQPCEICGGVGQAHHDSYYPEKWLAVRWLCGKHHSRWHAEHEPEWPTIFEYHPTDAKQPVYTKRHGRPPKPWLRTASGRWYVKLNGKAHNLGPNRDQALRQFEALLEHAAVTVLSR